MASESIKIENLDLNIISRINESVDLSDADKNTLIKLILVKNANSIDINQVKEQARKDAIEEYKKEHKEFISRIKKEIILDIIQMIKDEEANKFDDFTFDHQIDANELIKKIKAKYNNVLN